MQVIWFCGHCSWNKMLIWPICLHFTAFLKQRNKKKKKKKKKNENENKKKNKNKYSTGDSEIMVLYGIIYLLKFWVTDKSKILPYSRNQQMPLQVMNFKITWYNIVNNFICTLSLNIDFFRSLINSFLCQRGTMRLILVLFYLREIYSLLSNALSIRFVPRWYRKND